MSRVSYNDDCYDVADMLRGYAWEHNTRRAFQGRRGQRFLRELRDALEAMPVKRLAGGSWVIRQDDLLRPDGTPRTGAPRPDVEGVPGDVCALGVVARAHGIPDEEMPDDYSDSFKDAADMFDIAPPMAWAILEENDELNGRKTPEERYENMLAWVKHQIREDA